MIFSENKVPYDASTMRDIEEGLIIAEGEKPKYIQKNITENGTYRASSDNVDGYSSVVANVPNTYSLSDEGKVVSDGALVAQTAYPTEITENDTYDTTNYNSITVNVSGGAPSSNISDVNFYDYDGTVVTSYTAEDFANLTAMPANPTHEGLTAQGWNWSLSDAKNYVANNRFLNIGQMYITSDGKTRFYYKISNEPGNQYLSVPLNLGEDTKLDIDWGDDSKHTIWTNEEEDPGGWAEHEYSAGGWYVVTITVIKGSFSHQGVYDSEITVLKKVEIGENVTFCAEAFAGCQCLESITIPNNIEFGARAFDNATIYSVFIVPSSLTSAEVDNVFYGMSTDLFIFPSNLSDYSIDELYLSSNGFRSITVTNNTGILKPGECPTAESVTILNPIIKIDSRAFYESDLRIVTIPNSVTSIGENAFEQCDKLETIVFESNSRLKSIENGTFSDCYALTSITIPNSVISIGEYAFYRCESLETITFEANSSLETIEYMAFNECSALTSITIPNSVTNIESSVFYDCNALTSITFESTTPPTLEGDLYLPTTCVIRVPQGTLSAYTSAENYPDSSTYTYEEY